MITPFKMMELLCVSFFDARARSRSMAMKIHLISHVRLSRSRGEDPSIDVHNNSAEPSNAGEATDLTLVRSR